MDRISHLSVSSRLQQKAYYQMASTFQKEQTGTSIVLNAKTGFVEAMVSFPCYDPNLFTGGISKEDYAAPDIRGKQPAPLSPCYHGTLSARIAV